MPEEVEEPEEEPDPFGVLLDPAVEPADDEEFFEPDSFAEEPEDSLPPESMPPESLLPESLLPESLLPESLLPDSLDEDSFDTAGIFDEFSERLSFR
ncbi:MAG: hypothetical protein ABI345_07340 [Jatrophihabitans sp.]